LTKQKESIIISDIKKGKEEKHMSKNKNSYIDKKIEELEGWNVETNVDMVKNSILGIAGLAFFAAPAVFLYNWVPVISTILALFDLMVAEALVYNLRIKQLDKEQIKDQIKHLKNIRAKGIKSGRSLGVKRLERIAELEDQQVEIQNKENWNTALLVLGGAIWFGAAVATIINTYMPLIALLGAVITTVSVAKSIKGDKEYSKLQTRISNLRNDLELEPIYGTEAKTPAKTESIKVKKINDKDKTKALVDTTTEELVDKYIETLEKSEVVEKTLQKTKNK
jgi:hypothetical protein